MLRLPLLCPLRPEGFNSSVPLSLSKKPKGLQSRIKKCGNTILFKDIVWQSLNEAILQSCSQVCTCCSDLWCSCG